MAVVNLPRLQSNSNLLKAVRHAPGEGVADVLGFVPFIAKANQIDAGDISGNTTIQLFSVPANTLIYDIVIDITEAFTASTTLSVGDGSDVDRFMDTTAAGATVAGMKSMKSDAQPGSGGAYIYTSSDTIDLVVGGATPTAGTIDVYLWYVLNANELGGDSLVRTVTA